MATKAKAAAKAASAKTPKPKAKATVKTKANVENLNWDKCEEILARKKKQYEDGVIEGHVFNTRVKPLIGMYEAGNRSIHLFGDIHAL